MEFLGIIVSIPERVLEALKHLFGSNSVSDADSFNPWKGFRGFEAREIFYFDRKWFGFNPWKGFRGFEAPNLVRIRLSKRVSIPERVLEALKPNNPRFYYLKKMLVSIPERVLEALKLILKFDVDRVACVSIPERVLEALKQI